MTLTPFPQDAAGPLPPRRQKPVNHPTTCKHLSSIEEKDISVFIESISSGTASPADRLDTPFNECLKKEICSTPFGQPAQREIILDPFGLPLFPQPLQDEGDPLSWSQRKKIIILLQISILSFLAQFLAVCIVSYQSGLYDI
jgi:hypothetical protein